MLREEDAETLGQLGMLSSARRQQIQVQAYNEMVAIQVQVNAEQAREDKELQEEQRRLDLRRFTLLLEHEDALRGSLRGPPPSTAWRAEAARHLEHDEAARHELMARWGWDATGRPVG